MKKPQEDAVKEPEQPLLRSPGRSSEGACRAFFSCKILIERSIMTENREINKARSQKTVKPCNCRELLSYSRDQGTAGRIFSTVLSAILCILILFSSPDMYVRAEEGYDDVAGSTSMGKTNEKLAPYGMTPVSGNMIKDGEYIVGTECSSSFFHIEEAKLIVRDGKMTALLTMSSSSYLLVYPGTAEEAAAAPYEDYIPSVEIDTWDTFTIPVEALDAELDLAAFSKKKKKWYPRKILFHAADIPADCLLFEYPDYDRISQALALYDEAHGTGEGEESKTETGSAEKTGAGSSEKNGAGTPEKIGVGSSEKTGDSSPEKTETGSSEKTGTEKAVQNTESRAVQIDLSDGEYSIEVSLAGGSGRASVTTPTWMIVRESKAYARLLWSSPYYDYMILDGKKYLNETTDGGSSSFTIPITAMDAPMEIIADTTAMGDPVEIEYTLTFYEDTIGSKSRVPQEGALRVLAGAAVFIVVGGILNHLIKKRRR